MVGLVIYIEFISLSNETFSVFQFNQDTVTFSTLYGSSEKNNVEGLLHI